MKRNEVDYEEELRKSFNRWEDIYINGCNDPFHTDGTNLNLVRNHILSFKRQLEEKKLYPEIYYKETPPEVDYKYMAKSEEIIDSANKILNIYLNNEDYQYLISNINRLNKTQLKEITHLTSLNYINGFKNAVVNRELVYMQRNLNTSYIETLHCAREQVQNLLDNDVGTEVVSSTSQVIGQISLFELDCEEDEDYEID